MNINAAVRIAQYTRDAMPDWREEIAMQSATLDALAKKVSPKTAPAELATLIRALHDTDTICDDLWSAGGNQNHIRSLSAKRDAIESRLAEIFGAQRGWRLCKRFPWNALVGDMRDGDVVMSNDLPPFADHPLFYSDLHGPVAIAAQEYNFNDSKRAECLQFALTTGMVFEMPDFLSWHARGTTMILWRRK